MAFDQKQIRQLRARLKPHHVRTRHEDGNTFHYLEGWHVIAEANRIFGFDGWDREMVESTCVYTKHLGVRFEAVYITRVRITVKTDGHVITREGSGTGEASTTSPGKAHELALKAAETDATKRALMTFGNAFGLSLYDPGNPFRNRPASSEVERNAPLETAGQAATRVVSRAAHSMINRAKQATVMSGAQGRTSGQKPAAILSATPNSADGISVSDTRSDVPATAEGGKPSAAMDSVDQPARADLLSELDTAAPKQNGSAATQAPQTVETRQPEMQARIDKSALTLSEPTRLRDPEHLKFVVRHGCAVCGRNRTHAHHLTFAQPHALGRKVSDEYTVPLCARHHQELHQAGNEENWWRGHKLDPLGIADDLWEQSRKNRVAL